MKCKYLLYIAVSTVKDFLSIRIPMNKETVLMFYWVYKLLLETQPQLTNKFHNGKCELTNCVLGIPHFERTC